MESFSEAHAEYLTRLDEAYQELRKHHADPEMLNTNYEKYKKANIKFNELIEDIFRLKEVWEQAKRLKKG